MRCISCGQCAQVCNYKCVRLSPDFFLGPTTPKIFQRESPCFLCMKCSAICPTGALRDVPMSGAGMGKAALDKEICLNHRRERRVSCWTCYERCPLKGTAIILEKGYTPKVMEELCAGCGVCEYVCPTGAIKVTPARFPAKKSA